VARKLAVKRLSAVEIDPGQSHQHEFHAGRLRKALGFGDERISGNLRLHVHRGNGLVVDEGAFTLYDARELTPGRTEWHLYYTSKSLPSLVGPSDLLVLFRPDDSSDLAGIVAASGTAVETELLRLVTLDPGADLRRFLIVEPPRPQLSNASGATQTLFADDELGSVRAARDATAPHPLVTAAMSAGRIPGTAEMAHAAEELIGNSDMRARDPDRYLVEVLQIETDLFFQLEKVVHDSRLQAILDGGGAVPEVLDWAMGVHQARRSRRGQSLQLHFASILDARGIRYIAQCSTEAGETPDFVTPGCHEYHDEMFPESRLRMVACKSTSKERWRQVLNEAHRINPKFLLTLDTALTPSTIDQMLEAQLVPHIPAPIVSSAYAANPRRDRIRSVEDLLVELEAATL
jgi:hypothetical protein